MIPNSDKKLSTYLDDQTSVGTIDNSHNIVKFLLKNLDYLNIKQIKDSNFLSSMIGYLNKNNSLPFPITEQMNLFFKKNNKDINLIFKYFSFRYKFYLASVNKIDLDHPPYLLVEPVSTCNLRCGLPVFSQVEYDPLNPGNSPSMVVWVLDVKSGWRPRLC